MHAGYEDILHAAVGKTPLWFDENGVPRFQPHHPRLAADIYADEAVLLRIACQSCLHEQLVQMTWGSMQAIQWRIRVEWAAFTKGDRFDKDTPYHTLADSVRDGSIHYGDPPHHDDDRGEFCHAGCTMNVYDLTIEEFWQRKDSDWFRVPALEIVLPDGKAMGEGRLGEDF